MLDGASVRLSNLQGDPVAAGLPPAYPPAHAALAAPLTSPSAVYGWICLIDKVGSNEFTAEDEHLLTILAAQVGRIYENGGLLVQVQRYTEDLLNEMAEREHAVAELRESERRYSQMLGNVRLISVMLDTAARITYCNDYLLYLSGWSREEVMGRNWFEVFAPPDSTHWQALWAALLQDNPLASHNESELMTRFGERRHVRWSNSLLRTAAGAPIGTASIGEDTTEHKAAIQKVLDSEERFRQLAENIDDLFYIASPDFSRMLYLSPAYERIWGRARDADCDNAMIWPDAIHPDDRERVLAELKANGVKRSGSELDFRILRPDGTIRWIHSRTFPVLDKHGDVVRVVGAATDVTERTLAQRDIEKLNRVLALLGAINALIVRVTDRRELLQLACRVAIDHGQFKFARIALLDATFGEVSAVIPRDDKGSAPAFFLPPVDLAADEDTLISLAMRSRQPAISNDLHIEQRSIPHLEAMLDQGYQSVTVLPLIIDNVSIGCLVLITDQPDFFTDSEMRVLLEMAADVSFALDHIAKAERLKYLAYFDAMTGLPNRILFAERVSKLIEGNRGTAARFALMVADTRRFESINESFGRYAGDLILKQVAERFADCVGNLEDVARVGPDQFAALIHDAGNETDIARRIDQWRARWLSEPFPIDRHELRLSARVGIAVFPDDGIDAAALLQNAESALRRAKATDAADLFYTPHVGLPIANELAMEQKLRRGLINGEFVLHYQPKVDLQTRQVTGLEALLRWQSPDMGLVPPVRFIQLLEDTGLIVEIGAWVLHQAIHDRSLWYKLGISAPRVAVNLSTVQLRKHDFVENMTRILKAGGSDAGIDFEITESVIINDVECNIAKLKTMRDLGVSIAIDDFGTGYSSLSYLARLPVELLKIDRSFVSVMLDDPAVMTLVSTIVTLAHALQLTAIAEGVELEEQAKILHLLRCDQMQGYLISKPLGFDEMTNYLRHELAETAIAIAS